MALDKIFGNGDLDKVADSVFSAVSNSTSEIKAMQKRKAAENVQIVVQALKKIESDLQDKYDGVTTGIEKRVASIKNGKDGQNGVNGKDGRDGRLGRDGATGARGNDGMPGRNGIDGVDGVSVTNAFIDFDGSLIINLSSGQTLNVGEVVAPDLAEKIKVITNGGGTSQQVLDTLISLQNQINNLIPDQTGNAGKFLTTDGTDVSWAQVAGGLTFEGTWNATTNTPTLASGVGINGEYYITDTAGATNLDGITDWEIGDWLLFNGTVWQKIDQSNLVSSVNGQVGVVSLTTTNINEGTNLYYTDVRVRDAISAGTGISYDSATGVVTNAAPDQTVSLTGAGTTTISGTYPNFEISSTDANVGTVTSVSGTGAVSGISLSGTVTSSGNLTLGGSLDLSSPPTIGNTAPNTGAFTTLSTTGALTYGGVTLSNSVTGTGNMVLSNSPTLVTPALGTPASGVVTNLTGTASININGTVGATTASTGAFTNLSYTGTLTGGTGVVNLGSGQVVKLSNGNVGIGTSSPAARLDVVAPNFGGGPAIGARFNTSNVRLGFNIGNLNGFVYIGSNTNNKTSSDTPTYDLSGHTATQLRLDNGAFVFKNAPSGTAGNDITFTERMRITSAGNVGIGTSSPATTLHLRAAVCNVRLEDADTSAFANVGVDNSGSLYLQADPANSQASTAIYFATDGSERMRIDSSGNLLVGTTDVSGAISNNNQVVAGSFRTRNSVTSIASIGVATTVMTFNNNDGIFMVSMLLGGTGAPSTDNAVAIVCVNGGSATKTDLKTGSNMVISLSGLNLRATQNLFGGANVSWSVMRLNR